MPREPALFRAMKPNEQKLALALDGCRFGSGAGFTKRFARTLAHRAEQPEPQITEKQLAMLFKLVRKFRRQIPPHSLFEEHRFLLDPSIPLPEAPLSLVRSDVNDSRSAPPSRDAGGQPDQVEGLPGQLSFAEVASG